MVERETAPVTMRHMKTCQPFHVPGFFAVELRGQWLLAKGNSLNRLDSAIDWESFRPLLAAVWDKPAKGPGGPRPHDPLQMFKAPLVQRFSGLSDEQTEYQINDRLSFQQFIGWTLVRRGGLANKVSDANTLWDCRPRQRRLVRLGFRPRQRACVPASRQTRFVGLGCRARLIAASAHQSAETETLLAKKKVTSQIHKRAYRNWSLTDEQKESNRQKHESAGRIEHVFDYMSQTMKGFSLRYIGRQRNAAAIAFINLIYNLARYEQIARLQFLPLRAV